MARTISHAAAEITLALGGRWSEGKRTGTAHCPAHDDREPSLSIRVGERRVLFKCFARCTSAEVVDALLRRGIDPFGHAVDVRMPPSLPQARSERSDLGLRLWRDSRPARGTIAERYLAARGVAEVADLLRFHPRAPVGSGAELRRLPALIAPVANEAGLVTVQRTFLDPAGTPRKPFKKPKRVLSHPGDGAIRLGRPDGALGLAEGLEDAAAAMLWFGLPVWGVMGAERYARVAIPHTVTQVFVFGQNNAAARIGFERALAHLRGEQARAVELRTPSGHEDWNDSWLAGK